MAYISAKRVPSSHSGLSLGERVPNQHSGADYAVTAVSNPYGCNETNVISQYRLPLPATNLPFLSAVMFDGRESTPLTGTTKILYANYPASLESDLAHQALDATVTHAQGDGARPTSAEQQEIVNFETALFTAQSFGFFTGPLNSSGGNGGPIPLAALPFFISINSSALRFTPERSGTAGRLDDAWRRSVHLQHLQPLRRLVNTAFA